MTDTEALVLVQRKLHAQADEFAERVEWTFAHNCWHWDVGQIHNRVPCRGEISRAVHDLIDGLYPIDETGRTMIESGRIAVLVQRGDDAPGHRVWEGQILLVPCRDRVVREYESGGGDES